MFYVCLEFIGKMVNISKKDGDGAKHTGRDTTDGRNTKQQQLSI